MDKKIINVLIGILFLALFPVISATCNTYDNFSYYTLDPSRWEEKQESQGWPFLDEYFIEDGVYHMAQLNVGTAATNLEIINKTFYPGDIIEYDVNYVSGSGNRVHTVALNGISKYWALFGFWNTISDGGIGNDLGLWHIKIIFTEYGALAKMTRPDGTVGLNMLSAPSSQYTFGLTTGTGHNGLVHMDYDNVTICTEDVKEPNPGCVIPYDGMIINEDTTFCKGKYDLPNGMKIGSDITLDCNGAELIGKHNNSFLDTGIWSRGRNNTILNCIIKNYTIGIELYGGNSSIIKHNKLIENYHAGVAMINTDYNYIYDNVIINNNFFYRDFIQVLEKTPTIGISLGWTPHSNHNVIEKNNLSGSGWGVDLGGENNSIINNEIHNNRYSINFRSDAEMNNITKNVFRNNWMIDGGNNNNIWQNDFYTYGIYGGSGNNSYCINCISNNYYNGATGPTCPLECDSCVIPYDGMIITENTTFCQGEYNLFNGIKIGASNITLDCDGAVLNGGGIFTMKRGISILEDGITIKNCNIKNYYTGLRLDLSLDTKIINNTATYNQNGFIGSYFSNAIIVNNTAKYNTFAGFYLFRSSNNRLENNFVEQNTVGLFLGYDSNGNSIIQNNFINNGRRYRILGNDFINKGRSFYIKNSSNNQINYNNIITSADYFFYFDSYSNITARYNYWGTIDSFEITSKIYNGQVDFLPFLCEPYPTNFISNENGECILDDDNNYLEERIIALEEKVEELENRISWLESIVDKIIDFIKNLPKGLSKHWIN